MAGGTEGRLFLEISTTPLKTLPRRLLPPNNKKIIELFELQLCTKPAVEFCAATMMDTRVGYWKQSEPRDQEQDKQQNH